MSEERLTEKEIVILLAVLSHAVEHLDSRTTKAELRRIIDKLAAIVRQP